MNRKHIAELESRIKQYYPYATFFDSNAPFFPDKDDLREYVDEVKSAVISLALNGVKCNPNVKNEDSDPEVEDTTAVQMRDRIDELERQLFESERDYINKVHEVNVRGKEIAKLNGIIHEKNVLIRNLIKERGKVARLLAAEKTTHDIDLQATKSAESALIYKEGEYEKSLKEKDEVIDDLSKELARSKEREEELVATVKDYVNEIEELKSKKKPKSRFSAPKQGRVIVFSSGNPHNSFLDELRKSFFED